MEIEWGGLADWVTGVSTVALAAVTAWGLHTQRQDIQRQQRELADQQEQLNEQRELTRRQTELITRQLNTVRTAQARRVDAQGDHASFELAGHGVGDYQLVRVDNGSDHAVYEVDCILNHGGGNAALPVVVGRMRGPGGIPGPRFTPLGPTPRPILRAGEWISFVFAMIAEVPTETRFTVSFTDEAGVHWEVDEQQRLTEISARVIHPAYDPNDA
jgi:hypothetical protein